MTAKSATDITWRIANGYAWRLEYSFDVPASTTHYIGITTGPDGAYVLDRGFSTEGTDTLFTLYRGTTFTGGTPITITNRNDQFWGDTNRSPVTTLNGGVTATPLAANRMSSLRLYTVGQLERAIGSDATGIVFAPNSNYVLAIANNVASAKISNFSAIIVRGMYVGSHS